MSEETKPLAELAQSVADEKWAKDRKFDAAPPSTLHRKLAEVTLAVDRIPKRGRNTFHNYDYATEADIAQAIRSELASRGVTLSPSLQGYERERLPDRQTKEGLKPGGFLTTARIRYSFTDSESGEILDCDWAGTGEDGGDKGLYKAMTGAHKYFLMKFFMIPTGDDPEREKKRGAGTAETTQRRAGSPPPASKLDERALETVTVTTSVAGADGSLSERVSDAKAIPTPEQRTDNERKRFWALLRQLAAARALIKFEEGAPISASGAIQNTDDGRTLFYLLVGNLLKSDIDSEKIKSFDGAMWSACTQRLIALTEGK